MRAIGLLLAGMLAFIAVPAMAQQQEIKVCTGPKDGNYQQAAYKVRLQLKEQAKVILVDPTNGSPDNIDRVMAGQCDIAPIQYDAWVVKQARNAQVNNKLQAAGPLYLETVHLLCNKDVQASRIPDLRDGKVRIAIGLAGGGSAVTWDTFIVADKAYEAVPTDPMRGVLAIDAAKLGNEIGCVLFTSALNSPSMREANDVSEGKLKLIGVNDGDFDKVKDPNKSGKPLYQYVDIPSGTYPKLQNGRVKTVAVQAMWIANREWVQNNEEAYTNFIRAKNRAQPDILQMVGQTGG